MKAYKEIKKVLNTCPHCGKQEWFRLRYQYENEGTMSCTPCKHEAECEDAPADIDLSHQEIALLHEALGYFIHTEINCAGGVDGDYKALHLKLGEYLHG